MYHRFGWGDQRSLVERPAEAGTDVREALVRFTRKDPGAADGDAN